jgi:hypothetical protein
MMGYAGGMMGYAEGMMGYAEGMMGYAEGMMGYAEGMMGLSRTSLADASPVTANRQLCAAIKSAVHNPWLSSG